MPRQRQDHLTEMKDWFIRLQSDVEANGFLRHQDSHIELENFFRDLLNHTFGWKLDNANALFGINQDSFDLSDATNRIAIQVTVTMNAAKVRKTLKSFIGNHDKNYKRLIFVHPVINPPKSVANFTSDLEGYDFDAARDRFGLGTILQKAQNLNIDQQSELLNLLRRELQPLGTALQMGIDQTVETLIAVIQYMSENAPIDKIAIDERLPDLQQKLRRLHEHAEYLLGQYRINQALHATISQARIAIGYDSARVAKIQAWLKTHSIESLSRHENDAQTAFQSLVTDLLQRAHSYGTNAEETAVRFLLADEFIRCNVFPNPET